MQLQSWQAPGGSEELAIGFGPGNAARLLVLPAWFDESNKLRHFTIQAMRALEKRGLASVMPDLPGCNESLASLEHQDLAGWRSCVADAATQLGCTHVLAIRAGANIAPALPGFAFAPLAGKSALRALLRARSISAKEAGREEKSADLLQLGKAEGLDLAGYRLGAYMIAQLADAELPATAPLTEIKQAELGGPALWLRMEPDHDQQQAETLAALIAADIAP